jgi:phosphoribosylformylglycinamidine synthase subunit PurL
VSAGGGGGADTLALTADERARIERLIGRPPTRVELHLFDVQWSEHCSYKSSRALLKELPTDAPTVILGPGEDAGILRLPEWEGREWALVVAHESHNHPSQVVPEEGAATGIGGIVRDVSCMGAEVIAVMDGLRFGDPHGARGRRVVEIARGVVSGIWHYGNAIGVPNLGGDTVFHPSFDENCLVNVVAAGLVPSDEIVRSSVPQAARDEDYVLILLGKPTDWSGMGGATLASRVLDEKKDETDRGAVQAADPFLKRVLFEANREVFRRLHEAKIPFGMKDLGAGGVGGMSAEIAAKGGFGMEVDLDRVLRVDADLPAEVIACAETQERFGIVVPARIAGDVLAIYNEMFALPVVHHGAGASVIGRVLREPVYRLLRRGEAVADVSIEALVEGIRVERAAKPRERAGGGANAAAARPSPLALLADAIGSPQLASRALVHRYYDTEVQARAVVRPGEADAAILRPVPGAPFGVAFSLDGNPRLGLIDPFAAAMHAVCEGVRNVVAAGATPIGLTDCLNFGSPEDPEVYWDFQESIRGLALAARTLGLRDHPESALPFVSGNVSFYNQSVSGRAIAPSPIIGTFGLVEEIAHATTLSLKAAGDLIVLVGPRSAELGGTLYAELVGMRDASRIAPADLEGERARARLVESAIRAGIVRAAHDISEGGLIVAAFEMAVGSRAGMNAGLRLERATLPRDLSDDAILWSESGGYLLEVAPRDRDALDALAERHDVEARVIGEVTSDGRLHLEGFATAGDAAFAEIDALRSKWERGLGAIFGDYTGGSREGS